MHTTVCCIHKFLTFTLFFLKLGDLVQLVRGRLSKMQRAVMSALIVIEVHAKDVAAKLVEQKVSSVNDFEWISQLRLSVLLFCNFSAFYFHFRHFWLCIIILQYCGGKMTDTDLIPFVDITGQKMTCTSVQWMQSFYMGMSTLVTLDVWSSPHSLTGSC